MRGIRLKKLMVLIMFAVAILVPLPGMATESVNIEGVINVNYQIVDSEGQVYEVADTSKGNELVEDHIGEKVKVTGTIETSEDIKVITVMSWETIE